MDGFSFYMHPAELLSKTDCVNGCCFKGENEAFLREKIEINLTRQKHREIAEKAEMTTMEKLRQMRMRRSREDVSKSQTDLAVPTFVR